MDSTLKGRLSGVMRCAVKPLYRVQFSYSAGWGADLAGPENPECQFFFLAEGHCEGRISGQFPGANHPHRRSDGTFLPNFQGVIETDDGAEVLFDHRGYGRAYPIGRRQIVVSATHLVANGGLYKRLYVQEEFD
jgi:hypothetical protein